MNKCISPDESTVNKLALFFRLTTQVVSAAATMNVEQTATELIKQYYKNNLAQGVVDHHGLVIQFSLAEYCLL